MSRPGSRSKRRAPTSQGGEGNFYRKHSYYQTRTQDYNFSIVASLNVYDDDGLSMAVSKHFTCSLNLRPCLKNYSTHQLLNCSHVPSGRVGTSVTAHSSVAQEL